MTKALYRVSIAALLGFREHRRTTLAYVQSKPANPVFRPASTTFWRYLDALTINHGKSLLKILSWLRQQAWKPGEIQYRHIAIDINTTVETIYGDQETGRP